MVVKYGSESCYQESGLEMASHQSVSAQTWESESGMPIGEIPLSGPPFVVLWGRPDPRSLHILHTPLVSE